MVSRRSNKWLLKMVMVRRSARGEWRENNRSRERNLEGKMGAMISHCFASRLLTIKIFMYHARRFPIPVYLLPQLFHLFSLLLRLFLRFAFFFFFFFYSTTWCSRFSLDFTARLSVQFQWDIYLWCMTVCLSTFCLFTLLLLFSVNFIIKILFFFLLISVPPNIDDSLSSSDVIVREGANVTLMCHASGSPTPNVKWKRDDGAKININKSLSGEYLQRFFFFLLSFASQVTNFKFRNYFSVMEWEGGVLELSRISRLDMGAYLCIASNGVPPTVSKRIKVSVDCE